MTGVLSAGWLEVSTGKSSKKMAVELESERLAARILNCYYNKIENKPYAERGGKVEGTAERWA